MEPADLKSPSPDDASFEAWYRAHATRPPVPNHGFTGRVLAALPPPRKSVSSQRGRFCLAGALLGGAVAWSGGLLEALGNPGIEVEQAGVWSPAASPGLGLALGLVVVSLLYVYRDFLRRRIRVSFF
ncbi:MAG: hypothetical protein U1F61_24845 [Opitutaceae bacterium]